MFYNSPLRKLAYLHFVGGEGRVCEKLMCLGELCCDQTGGGACFVQDGPPQARLSWASSRGRRDLLIHGLSQRHLSEETWNLNSSLSLCNSRVVWTQTDVDVLGPLLPGTLPNLTYLGIFYDFYLASWFLRSSGLFRR